MKNSTLGKSASAKKPLGAAKKKTKSARELWLDAVKTGSGTLGGGGKAKAGKPVKRSASEYWIDTLRKTGEGHSTESIGMNTFTGIRRPDEMNMAYLSTSHYLRQMKGTEKTPRNGNTANGKVPSGSGKPAYKTPEEYYDDILDLKKQVVSINNDNTTMKSKIRRLEEDNAKKEKEIEQLLDPSKSEEMRRTLADKRPDTGTVIHSLKQKILRLEQNLKEKEAAFAKLQSDMKSTKTEELRAQMEVYYNEVLRLQNLSGSQAAQMTSKKVTDSKEMNAKLKAMNETIIRLNDHNNKLQTENKEIKADLEKSLEQAESVKEKTKKDYEDMNKRELLSAISRLEKRMDKTDADTVSMISEVESRRGDVQGKVILEGTIAERLDQLDRRETELLEENDKHRLTIKKLKEDRLHYRRCCDDKDKEIRAFKKEIEFLQKELDSFYDKDKVRSPRNSPRKPPMSARSVTSVVSDTSTTRRNKRESSATSDRQRQRERDDRDRAETEERQRKLDELAQQRAARKIQKTWKGFNTNKLNEKEEEESTVMLQSAMRGHRNRKQQMSRLSEIADSDDDADDDIVNIQSTLRGHNKRKDMLRKTKLSLEESSRQQQQQDALILIQSTLKGHVARKQMLHNNSKLNTSSPSFSRKKITNGNLDSAGEDVDDDLETGEVLSVHSSIRPSPRISSAGSSTRKGFSRSTRSPPPRRATPVDDYDDDDDDIVF
ncbi:uncharacterized protein LOC141903482 isoform X2 [Tubulanus polymorphus]|uniref:uncharacterized protein LOC141903482 isoform X2 n=1 Tax=Tubulanus polymorphus TaxID=672921 RepID=UPI003DA2FA2E